MGNGEKTRIEAGHRSWFSNRYETNEAHAAAMAAWQERKDMKKRSAVARQEAFAALPTEQKLAKIAARCPEAKGKEVNRLLAQLEREKAA